MRVVTFNSALEIYGSESELNMNELTENLTGFAESSVQLENIKEFKQQLPILLGGRTRGDKPNQPELKRKRLQDIISRSLVALDIEPKNGQTFNISEVETWLGKLGLNSSLYTTFSSENGKRCRAFIEIGEEVESPERYEQLVQGLIESCPKHHTIDRASLNMNQVMVLPFAYVYEKPVVKRVEGVTFNEHLLWEESKYIVTRNRKKQHDKSNTLNKVTTPLSDSLFTLSVTNQWGELIPSQRHGNSWQFFRNDADKHPSLYSLSDMDAVIDETKSKYKTIFYTANDFAEAKKKFDDEYESAYFQALRWEESDYNCGIFSEGTGTGKSEVFVMLADCGDGKHRIFTFPSKKLRDEFASRCRDDCLTIFGNEEIVQIATSLKKEKLVKKAFQNAYASIDEGNSIIEFKKILNECKFLTKKEKDIAVAMHSDNSKKMQCKSRTLLMTHDKLEYVVSNSNDNWMPFRDSIIYSDEYRMGTVVFNESKRDVKKIRQLKRMYASAERIALIELQNNQMFPLIIGTGIRKEYDEGLTIFRNKSTAISGGKRKSLYLALEKHFDAVIANKCDSKWNLVNNKGSNKLRVEELCTILSYPDPSRMAKAKRCLKIDDDETIRELLVSSDASQAVGRNMSNRNKEHDNYHLVIIPEALPCKIDVVTPNAYRFNDWVERGSVADEYFANVINDITGLDPSKVKPHSVDIREVLTLIKEGDVIPSDWLAEEFRIGAKKVNKIAKNLGLKTVRRMIDGARISCIVHS